ncbi:AMP-binding protein [Streptomyces xanthophaeus]|uniref:AMP-binding protein n=1 Tax=Streptomyces xanthophaeus TaxID=67385 RepID=UPI0039900413
MPARFVVETLDAFERFGDRPATTFRGGTLTFRRGLDSVHRIARALDGLGVGRGSGVVCVAGDRPEALFVRLAAYVLGARFTPVRSGLVDHVLAHIVHDAEPALVVSESELPMIAAPLALSIDDLMDLAGALSADPLPVRARDEDIARITYTGGTTGRHKGAAGTYGALQALRGSWWHEWDRTTPAGLTYLSVTWSGWLALEYLYKGVRVEMLEEFSPEALLDACARSAPVATYLSPHMLYALLDHPATSRGVPGLVSLGYGTSRTSPARLREAADRFGPILRQGYGSIESGPVTVLSPEDHTTALRSRPHLLGSVGRPRPGTAVDIQDPSGTSLPPGRVGEVNVRSTGMMAGYWRRPELTARTLCNGWLRTGDLGYVDDDGYLYLVDRLNDVVTVNGHDCYSAPIEAALTRHPAVGQAAVVGRGSERTGEEIHAFLVPAAASTAGDSVAAEALRLVVRELTPVHEPVAVHWIDRMPLTAAGKPDKNQLRARLV